MSRSRSGQRQATWITDCGAFRLLATRISEPGPLNGSGLQPLSIVERVVDAHDGALTIVSPPGNGAEISIELGRDTRLLKAHEAREGQSASLM